MEKELKKKKKDKWRRKMHLGVEVDTFKLPSSNDHKVKFITLQRTGGTGEKTSRKRIAVHINKPTEVTIRSLFCH